MQGPITLNSGILQDFNNEALGSGKLTINGGTIEVGGFSITMPNAIVLNGNATLDGAVKSAIILGSSFTVAGNAVLTVTTTSFGSPFGVTVNSNLTLTTKGTAFMAFGLSIFGHVVLGTNSSIKGMLGADSTVDFSGGATSSLSGPLSGVGSINVSGVLINPSPANLSGYDGLLTLKPGGILATAGNLGTGRLVLDGGLLQSVANVVLTNQLTSLENGAVPLVFSFAPGATSLTIPGSVLVLGTEAITLSGGTLDFSGSFSLAKGAKLTVGGSGTVKVKTKADLKIVVPLSKAVSVVLGG